MFVTVSHVQLCIVYELKEVASFWEAPSINEHGT